jgi:hypothetical protein
MLSDRSHLGTFAPQRDKSGRVADALPGFEVLAQELRDAMTEYDHVTNDHHLGTERRTRIRTTPSSPH